MDKVTRPTPIDSFEGINVTSVGCGGWHSTAVTCKLTLKALITAATENF